MAVPEVLPHFPPLPRLTVSAAEKHYKQADL